MYTNCIYESMNTPNRRSRDEIHHLIYSQRKAKSPVNPDSMPQAAFPAHGYCDSRLLTPKMIPEVIEANSPNAFLCASHAHVGNTAIASTATRCHIRSIHSIVSEDRSIKEDGYRKSNTYHASFRSTLLRLEEDGLGFAANGAGFLDAGQLQSKEEMLLAK